MWLCELIVPKVTIAVDWDVKQQTKPNQNRCNYLICPVCVVGTNYVVVLRYTNRVIVTCNFFFFSSCCFVVVVFLLVFFFFFLVCFVFLFLFWGGGGGC